MRSNNVSVLLFVVMTVLEIPLYQQPLRLFAGRREVIPEIADVMIKGGPHLPLMIAIVSAIAWHISAFIFLRSRKYALACGLWLLSLAAIGFCYAYPALS